MKRCSYFLLLSFCLFSFSIQAQTKKSRILFILDGSSSMTYEWNKDYNRFAIARNILLQIVDSIYSVNNEVEFGVRIYGSEYPAQQQNCTDSRLLVDFNIQNVNQIKQSLRYIKPIGWSPIAYSLEQSAFGEINNTNAYDYSIIFITDGGESCNGDICKTFTKLLRDKIVVTPYIIGLDKNNILKSYYDCMGKYVSVTETSDIPKAVKLIVDENKPLLSKKKKLNLKTIYSNSPVKPSSTVVKKKVPPKPTIIPIERPQKDALTNMIPFLAKELRQTKQLRKRVKPLAYRSFPIEYSINFVQDEPKVKLPSDFYDVLLTLQAKEIQTRSKKELLPKELYMPRKLEFPINYEIAKPVVKRTADLYRRIRPFAPRHRYVYAYKIPKFSKVSASFSKLEFVFNYTPIKRTIVVKDFTKKPNVVPNGPAIKMGPNTQVSREVIPNDETMVQIFFVNKFQKTKMYRNASPRIYVMDAKTNAEVTSFRRTTQGGVPNLQPVQAGTYNFMVKGDNSLVTPNVRIDAKNINKIYIEVTDGSIHFSYKGNPKRPVKEFQAIVNPRFEVKNKTVIQECTDKLYYAPATYYIEINTLPATKFAMVELDFGERKGIQIDEPGFIQINNTNRLGKVDFLIPLNDKYVRFHSIKVNGNIIDQKVRLQPNRDYKAVYLIDPKVPALGTKELRFTVKSNETTQLILK